jgi:alpha-D-xyloside xylohydrolase
MLRKIVCFAVFVGAFPCRAVWAAPVTGVVRQADGVVVRMQPGVLRLVVMQESVIRVTYAAGATIPELHSFSVVMKPKVGVKWTLAQTRDAVTLATAAVRVRVDRRTGAVEFLDVAGKTILAESADGREISPAIQPGVEGTLVRQAFVLAPDEGIYGLGQH